MLKNYLKIAIRNLVRNKIYSAVSILSLAIGLAITLLVLRFLIFEISFDDFNKAENRIYSISVESSFYGNSTNTTTVPPHLSEELQKHFSQIESATFVNFAPDEIYKNNKIFGNPIICSSDSNLFNIFSLQFIKGSPKDCLSNLKSIVLTEKLAKKYFGTYEVLNQLVPVNVNGNKVQFKVTGIIKNIPSNSSIVFDAVIPKENTRIFKRVKSMDWHTFFGSCFIKVSPNADIHKLKSHFPAFIKNTGDDSGRKR